MRTYQQASLYVSNSVQTPTGFCCSNQRVPAAATGCIVGPVLVRSGESRGTFIMTCSRKTCETGHAKSAGDELKPLIEFGLRLSVASASSLKPLEEPRHTF